MEFISAATVDSVRRLAARHRLSEALTSPSFYSQSLPQTHKGSGKKKKKKKGNSKVHTDWSSLGMKGQDALLATESNQPCFSLGWRRQFTGSKYQRANLPLVTV